MPESELASNGPARESAEPAPTGYGLGTATYVVISSMVGAGALTTSGYVLLDVPCPQYLILVWAVGGVVALCGALTLAELSAALPRSGGEYVILHEAFGRRVAFLSGWVSLLLGFAAPIAAVASASATYLLTPFGQTARLPTLALASAAILLFTVIHIAGPNHTSRVQAAITLLKVAFLVGLVCVGGYAGRGRAAVLTESMPIDRGLGIKMVFALVYVYYAYTGWNAAAYLAGEVSNPRRVLPRSILIGTAIVVLLYVGVNVFYGLSVSVAELQELAMAKGKDAVKPIAELAAQRAFGPVWAERLSFAIGLMLLGSLSAFILTGPRVALAMARAGQLPRRVGGLWGPGKTPAFATCGLTSIALVMLWSGSFDGIILFSEVGLALLSLGTVSAVYVLRRTRPHLPRPFRVPGYPVIPALYLVTTTAVLAAAFWEKPRTSALALVVILAGLPLYELAIRRLRSVE